MKRFLVQQTSETLDTYNVIHYIPTCLVLETLNSDFIGSGTNPLFVPISNNGLLDDWFISGQRHGRHLQPSQFS